MTERVRTAILISGRGSNMSALIEAAREPAFAARIALVLSDKPQAGGLLAAREAGIEARAVDRKLFANRAAFEAALQGELAAADIALVCLAGFMRVLSPDFVAAWEGRILNIHPSLLPDLKGLHTHERALQEARQDHGCTVHVVSAELDSGPVLAQARVPVLPGDTPDSLAARVLIEEHRIYPQALDRVARALREPDDPGGRR
jgi:phosphoribosylglycinamide formyltransferase-1